MAAIDRYPRYSIHDDSCSGNGSRYLKLGFHSISGT